MSFLVAVANLGVDRKLPNRSGLNMEKTATPAILRVPPPTKMQYDFFMGLAAVSAMPVAAAVALLCVPLAAQSRPPESNPKHLVE